MTSPRVGEEEVDFEAVDDLFGERRRKTGCHRDRAKEDLQIGVGEAEGALVEELAQDLDATLSGVVVESQIAAPRGR